ncbi:MAG: prepilin-type N-terminal cleavage/methylation domain-containing protein [Patescibacteria group bacterium]
MKRAHTMQLIGKTRTASGSDTGMTALPPAGFTLVETLVAITILMIAIVGPFYSVQQAISASYAARDQLIASSLAQEGAEYIYFLRDNNYLSGTGNSWLQNMDACKVNTLSDPGCTVDPTQGNALAACSSSGCLPLRLSSTGLYTQNTLGGYPVTRFTRTVKILQVSASEAKVVVQVTWSTSHRPYTITVTDDLYNWL